MYFLDSCTHFLIDKLSGHARPKECEEMKRKKILTNNKNLGHAYNEDTVA